MTTGGPERRVLAPFFVKRELAAQANVATAKANADARMGKAKGDAESIQVEAEAIRNNPEIVKMRAVEKWDGRLPTYTGGGPMPFVDVK